MHSSFLKDLFVRSLIGFSSLVLSIGMIALFITLRYSIEKKENFQVQLTSQNQIIEQKTEERKVNIVKKTEKRKPKKRKSEAVIIADEIVRVAQMPEIKKRFDKRVFTDDFFVALQFQESRAKTNAVSSKGAKGKYQVTPIAVKAVVEYLDDLREKNGLEYKGPSEISQATAKKIADLFAHNPQYDEANGKLYFLSIHDKDSQYNQKPNRDVFRGKSIKTQQRLSLYCYLGGPDLRLNPGKVDSSGRKYASNVFAYMKTSGKLRKEINHYFNFEKSEVDHMILSFMREMEEKNIDPRNLAALEKKSIRKKFSQA